MDMKKWYVILTVALAACGLFKRDKQDEVSDYGDVEYLDTINIQAAKKTAWVGENEINHHTYNASVPKNWDLMHTDLDVAFDFGERRLRGIALLTLKHHFSWQDSLILDAKSMNIDSVSLSPDSKHIALLRWNYSGNDKLRLFLAKTRVYKDSNPQHHIVSIRIKYTANPYSSEFKGSSAISSERGLYFINHNLENPLKPRQIWTQGETESNSRWFPTLDAPNQKTTQRIAMTVPDTMVTLSNGKLIQSDKVDNNMRRDVWEHKLPHAPYLVMMAIGNWAVVKDKWRNHQVGYLVEKPFEKYAGLIFGNTPQMLEFFSQYTGVDYPWGDYNQVVVRDFVSGAMENTSAVVHMEQLQHTPREHRDETYEDYVSHELFHHWFGDLVTTESWANITLNESFATYGEYLWREHKYGAENADEILQDFREQYRYSYKAPEQTLYRPHYHSREDVFDVVSYQKGALILHMLRSYLGESAFRAGIKHYLTNHAYKSAEVANLRLSFEEVTGKDLVWFFNQWYDDKSQPGIKLIPESDSSGWRMKVIQEQKHRHTYVLPLKIKYARQGKVYEEEVLINKRTFTWKPRIAEEPDWWIFDAGNQLLADVILFTKSTDEFETEIRKINMAFQQQSNPAIKHRLLELASNSAENIYGADIVSADSVKYQIGMMCETALSSGWKHLAPLAFDCIKRGLASGGPFDKPAMKLLNNSAANVNVRSSAFDFLSQYHSMPADSFIRFANDSSVGIAVRAISVQPASRSIRPVAMNAVLNDNSVDVVFQWSWKYLMADTSLSGNREVFSQLINNKIAGAEAFDRLISWYIRKQKIQRSTGNSYYYLMERLIPQLVDGIRKSGNIQAGRILNYRLTNEMTWAEQQYKQAMDKGKEPTLLLSDYLNAMKNLRQWVVNQP